MITKTAEAFLTPEQDEERTGPHPMDILEAVSIADRISALSGNTAADSFAKDDLIQAMRGDFSLFEKMDKDGDSEVFRPSSFVIRQMSHSFGCYLANYISGK